MTLKPLTDEQFERTSETLAQPKSSVLARILTGERFELSTPHTCVACGATYYRALFAVNGKPYITSNHKCDESKLKRIEDGRVAGSKSQYTPSEGTRLSDGFSMLNFDSDEDD